MAHLPVGAIFPRRSPRGLPKRLLLKLWGLPVLGLGLVAVGVVFWARDWGGPVVGEGGLGTSANVAMTAEPPLRVETIRPSQQGIRRTTNQPGSIHAFESVDLYAMLSGYLKTQVVNIGSPIKRGEVLAVIDVPRDAKAVEEAAAVLAQTKARAAQAETQVKTAEAERDTAAAAVKQAESDIDRLVAQRRLAEKQYARIKGLFEHNAIEENLVDEQRQILDAAIAAERTGRLAVQTAKAQWATALAKVDRARADVVEAQTEIGVAQARLDKAQVNLNYAHIVAPFDGVVTHRYFHPRAFIRSATEGGQVPLLSVMRTDLMRVVVQVPDRDVVLTNVGDPATVTVDALGGRAFEGKVARIAQAEDHATRTMRVEIDLPNPDSLLYDGMYGRVIIELHPPSGHLTVPMACLSGRPEHGQGVLYVVRSGKAQRKAVTLGENDGTSIEVLAGIELEDEVVLRPSGVLDDGLAVVARMAPSTVTEAPRH
jgi:HlyD family secretion protein